MWIYICAAVTSTMIDSFVGCFNTTQLQFTLEIKENFLNFLHVKIMTKNELNFMIDIKNQLFQVDSLIFFQIPSHFSEKRYNLFLI